MTASDSATDRTPAIPANHRWSREIISSRGGWITSSTLATEPRQVFHRFVTVCNIRPLLGCPACRLRPAVTAIFVTWIRLVAVEEQLPVLGSSGPGVERFACFRTPWFLYPPETCFPPSNAEFRRYSFARPEDFSSVEVFSLFLEERCSVTFWNTFETPGFSTRLTQNEKRFVESSKISETARHCFSSVKQISVWASSLWLRSSKYEWEHSSDLQQKYYDHNDE